MQQEQMMLKKQLEEANEKLSLAEEAADKVSTNLPVDLTKVSKLYRDEFNNYLLDTLWQL